MKANYKLFYDRLYTEYIKELINLIDKAFYEKIEFDMLVNDLIVIVYIDKKPIRLRFDEKILCKIENDSIIFTNPCVCLKKLKECIDYENGL